MLRAGVSATKFTVHAHEHALWHRTQHPAASTITITSTRTTTPMITRTQDQQPHRSLPKIFSADRRVGAVAAGRDRAKAMFQRLAEAEAAIHQMPVEQVHLHEVGALDSIIDIVGTVFALEWAGADRIVCSPLNVGGGMVHSAHGLFPVPAPATVQAARRRADLQRRGAEGARDADRRADRDVVRDRRSARSRR